MFGFKKSNAASRKRCCNVHQEDRTGSKRQRFATNVGDTFEEQAEYRKSQEEIISADFMQMPTVQAHPYEELPTTSAQALLNMSNYSESPSCSTADSMLVSGGSFGGMVTTEHQPLGSPQVLQNNREMSLLAGTFSGRLFTHDEVRSICRMELEAQEQMLRTEYEKLLNEQLADQQKIFETYVQDEIEKKYNGYLDRYLS